MTIFFEIIGHAIISRFYKYGHNLFSNRKVLGATETLVVYSILFWSLVAIFADWLLVLPQ